MVDPREERLPKWAQEQLRGLRTQLERERKLNADLRGEVGETNVYVQNYTSEDQPLPKDARIKYQTGPRFDEYVAVHTEGNRLWLHGGRFLIIHPHVSNAFYVTVGDR
ncbi:hypothetical protein HOS59_gp48 [Streptomyces phage Rowa]|uniref:Uncharacterized protein n=1 Tax=Streptomyces phage Rowa TaxID=2059883 RepID=A0A2H5BLY0_9CAUD|nr:hypothetical protein HOS59_gp48 [Streptomyces phage Rowa]AUG87312.1 hypothetical protein SEA_ROWA_48 [Streptomyces phage Rowa]